MELLGLRQIISKQRKLVKLSIVALVSATFAITAFPTTNVVLARDSQTTAKANFNDGSSKYLSEASAWTFNESPNYYKVLGNSGLTPEVFPEVGKILYSELDELGRTQTARGTLTYDNVAASYNVRQHFAKDQNPSGWIGNPKGVTYPIEWLNGSVYNGHFWNRSHLIADSLGGDALKVNAITGTRTQNVGGTNQHGGMRYTEMKAQKWLEANHKGHLYYEAMPVYSGDELVPRAVVVSMQSSDKSIDEKVIVYNTANGYTINYSDGTFTKN
ncbi:DNA/RNA non-specific endonuclease [Streptococcus catagoni]|uniref:DNA/RNA non-specific endonuclease n=1 Tax=Streptococcus catagoni TaxID=2654874 RepID=UPI001408F6CB|nr:DNA/RNA non-specific endonuclease [Streptococcus catagoni]